MSLSITMTVDVNGVDVVCLVEERNQYVTAKADETKYDASGNLVAVKGEDVSLTSHEIDEALRDLNNLRKDSAEVVPQMVRNTWRRRL